MKHSVRHLAGSLLTILLSGTLSLHAQQLDNLKNEKPLTLKGNIGANIITYSASGIESRSDPFGLTLTANASLSVYGFEMPFSFRYYSKKSEYTQPFNQFGLSPTYKWVTLHGGYRSVRFSDFTLAGHTFLGAGVELNPGKFRFGAIYGRFKKSTALFENEIDSTRTFDRKGYAVKLGVGTKKNFVDLSFLKIKDDSLSIKDKTVGLLSPEQNMVTGINSLFTLSKTLTFQAEFAMSLYTTDASIKPIEDPENPGILEKANKFIVINESSELTTAGRASLDYKTKKFGLRAEYRRIDPKYKSMGAYYFNDDVQNFTLAPSIPLFKRKLYLRGSIGLQTDNLRKTKTATTKRTISSANISFNPSNIFGIDFNYSNYSNNQKAGRLPLIDSLKFYQTTTNLSVTPRLIFTGEKLNHMIIGMVNRSGLRDKNENTAQYSESVATILNLNYNVNFNPSGLGLMAGFNSTKLSNFAGDNKISGITAGVNKGWLKGKLNSSFIMSFNHTNYLGEEGNISNFTLSGSYSINSHHSFRAGLFLIKQAYLEGSTNKSFSEFKGDISYVYNF